MIWKFNEDDSLYLDNTIYNNISIDDVAGITCSNIKYLAPHSSTEYLGHYKDVAGTQKAQEEVPETTILNKMAFISTSKMLLAITYTYYTTML